MKEQKEQKARDDRMRIYSATRAVPQEAIKQIGAGRLKGMSDINPMWRIKIMTETFGPCGTGWKYEIKKQWNETYGQETKAFVNVDLYYKKEDGEWSEPIPGTGGSTIVEVNSKGYLYVNDEGYKMALTDALSVAMKSLGVAADVYFQKDADYGTKYAQQQSTAEGAVNFTPPPYLNEVNAAKTVDELQGVWNKYIHLTSDATFVNAIKLRKEELAK